MIEFNIDEGLQLLNIAKGDLKASKSLYLSKLYSQALFYYQQSVEKSFKTMFYSMGLLSYKEMVKDISHNPLNIFVLIKKREKGSIVNLDKLYSKFPEIAKTELIKIPSKFYKSLDENKIREFFQISSEVYNNDGEIKDVVKSLDGLYKETIEISGKGKNNKLYKEFKESARNIDCVKEDMLREFFEALSLYPEFSDVIKTNEAIEEEINKLIKIFKEKEEIWIPFFAISFFLFVSLILISFLTKSLAIKARYIAKDFNPLDFYNTNHPLILSFKGLSKLQNKNLNLLKNWLGYLKETPEDLKEILWVLKKK